MDEHPFLTSLIVTAALLAVSNHVKVPPGLIS